MTTEGFTAVGVTFDAGLSKDFDGSIASYAWSDDQGNSGTGQRVTFYYDPCEINTVQVTLTVTDNDGRTDSITKRVRVRSGLDVRCPKTSGSGGGDENDWEDPPDPDAGEEDGDDSEEGGGVTVDTVVIAACGQYIIATPDSGDTWNTLAAGSTDPATVGTFRSVDTMFVVTEGTVGALLGTSQGELVWTDDAAVSAKVIGYIGGTPEITAIKADPTVYNRWWVAASDGRLFVNDYYQWYTFAQFQTAIRRIQIGPAAEIVCFAGDSGHPLETVIRGNLDGAFWSIVDGDLVDAAVNGNGAVDGRLYQDGTIVVVLNDGAEFEAWMSEEALYGATDWQPSDTGGYSPTAFGGAFHPDFGDGILASGTDSVVLTNEDGTLTEQSVNPFATEFGQINRIIPEPGIKDVFLAAAENALLKTTDAGVTWGAILPSQTLEGAGGWPSGATGYDIATGYQFSREPIGNVMIYLTDGSVHGTAELGFADKWIGLVTGLDGDVDNSGPMIGMTTQDIAFRSVSAGGASYSANQYTGAMELSTDGGTTWSSIVPPNITIGGSPVTFDRFHYCIFLPGENEAIWATWSEDDSGNAYGNRWQLFASEDDGASWDKSDQFASGSEPEGIPQNIAVRAENPDHLIVPVLDKQTSAPTNTGWSWWFLDLADSTEQAQHDPSISVPAEDYPVLAAWGSDRRALFIYTTAAGESRISYTDYSSGAWAAALTHGYDPEEDHGRPIGLIRAADSPVLFALFENKGPLKSTDNGATWGEMPNAQGFDGGIALDYDHNDEMLWVGRTVGEVYAWPCAPTIKPSLAIPMNATFNIDQITAYTDPGIGYNGIVARHNRRLV